MGKFDGILLCTDLDGTLLKKDHTVSAQNIAAIEYFKREGGRFTFMTGRMPFYSSDAYEAVKPNAPFGCVNGGGLFDHRKQDYIWTLEMPAGVEKLIQCIDEALPNVGIQLNTFYHTYFCKDNETMEHFRTVTHVPYLVCDYREMKEPIAKIIFGSESNEEILQIERILKAHPLSEQFDFIRSERALYEILPKGSGKGLALSKLTELLGIDPNKTVAVGDYNNDISMFRVAKIAVAVNNACRDAKNAADFITVSNEEHAIAQVIDDLEQGKYGI